MIADEIDEVDDIDSMDDIVTDIIADDIISDAAVEDTLIVVVRGILVDITGEVTDWSSNGEHMIIIM